MAWQRIRIEIPENATPDQRLVIGQEAVEAMKSNAVNGVGVNASGNRRKRFPKYSKEYAASKGQDNVDLTLSGEMLDALDVISHKKGSVLIGFDNGSLENSKAEGNIIGSYGGLAKPSKARNFLGLPAKELQDIVERNIG